MSTTVKESNGNKQHEAYEGLKKAIITNTFPPEKVLVERELCEMFGVSRTPIREALRRLSNEGLVTFEPGRGSVVTKLTYRDMLDVYELKEALERSAVRLCIRRKTDDVLGNLMQCIEDHAEAYNNKDYTLTADLDMKFHMLFVSATQNSRMQKLSESLYIQTRRLYTSMLLHPDCAEVFIRQHRKIYEAIKNSDEDYAEESISEHISEIVEYQKKNFDLCF